MDREGRRQEEIDGKKEPNHEFDIPKIREEDEKNKKWKSLSLARGELRRWREAKRVEVNRYDAAAGWFVSSRAACDGHASPRRGPILSMDKKEY